ncbi:unnamed protein product [Tuber melanosporum]|uniref:(Perigord truffle) hypothetical protein n=1 Tax=Tuber melanosporum (strain Mel28) TaxID=656061 RepID=D5G7A8_TUBMM|nr:uncharacterized protein GSTUM_00002418001 [Tuber melanosporum]CAZ80401.1 unnamed protein product [Tuber melanosporum]
MESPWDEREHRYRPARQLPYTLNERARVSIEETLYPSAVEFLNSISIPGTSTPSEAPHPAFIPPSTFQRCITTLIAHPYYTTQVSKNEPYSAAPGNAYLLLRRMLRLVGPLNAEFSKAWEFKKSARAGRQVIRGKTRGRGSKGKELDPIDAFSTDDDLNGDFATTESLFNVADDFWSIAGWAFTCSVSHPKRWEWWKLVLDLMMDVMEQDWEDRLETKEATRDKSALDEALFVKLLPRDTGSVGCKKIVRAIMTCAEEKSFNEWKEIWENELSTKRPRKIRIGTQDTAFMDDDDEEDDVEEKGVKGGVDGDGDTEMQDAHTSNEVDGLPSVSEAYGGMESVDLRQRLLSMLSTVCIAGCYVPTEDLFYEFTETFIRLPLPHFHLFTSTMLDTTTEYKCTLNQLILSMIISTKAPVYSGRLTATALINNYLPFEAKTTQLADNTRVAILLESLTRLLINAKLLEYSESLQTAVVRGIRARASKVPKSFPKPGTQKYLLDREIRGIWSAAETRLKGLAGILQLRKEEGAQGSSLES